MKSHKGDGTESPRFQGQSLVDARWRTINWAFFHALVQNVGSNVPTIADALHQNALNQQILQSTRTNSGEDQANVESFPPESDSDDHELDDAALKNDKETLADDDLVSDDVEDSSVVDEDREHINTLIQLTGNPNKYFDTERWCRMLLWTIHMYVDGHCSDYTFQYGKPYAPSSESVIEYIDQHDGDPFVLQAPVSSVKPLLPHQTAVALLPKPYLHLLPLPLQRQLENEDIANRVFPSEDEVNISEVVQLTEEIPLAEYSEEERKFLVHGEPFLLRRAFGEEYDLVDREFYRAVPKPGPKFREIRKSPAVVRCSTGRTTEPPCYPWPAGGVDNMLQLPYTIVAGEPLLKVMVAKNSTAKPSTIENGPSTRAHVVNQGHSADPTRTVLSNNIAEQKPSSPDTKPPTNKTRSNTGRGGDSDTDRESPKTQNEVDRVGRGVTTSRGRGSGRGAWTSRRTRGRINTGGGLSSGRGSTASRPGRNAGARSKGVKRVRDTTSGEGRESA